MLSRFPYTVNDIYKILINFKIDELELSKNFIKIFNFIYLINLCKLFDIKQSKFLF